MGDIKWETSEEEEEKPPDSPACLPARPPPSTFKGQAGKGFVRASAVRFGESLRGLTPNASCSPGSSPNPPNVAYGTWAGKIARRGQHCIVGGAK